MSISLPPGAGHEVAQEISTSLVPKPQIIQEQTAEQAAEQWVREGSAKLALALERQLDRRIDRTIRRLRSSDGAVLCDFSDCALLRDSGVEMLCAAAEASAPPAAASRGLSFRPPLRARRVSLSAP